MQDPFNKTTERLQAKRFKVGVNTKYNALAIFPDCQQGDCLALISPLDASNKEDLEIATLMAAAPDLLESTLWLMEQLRRLEGHVSFVGMHKCLEAVHKATYNPKPIKWVDESPVIYEPNV